MGEKIVAIDKHLITNEFKIYKKGWKEQKQVEKQIVKPFFKALPCQDHILIHNNGVLVR
jgi:ubiquitin